MHRVTTLPKIAVLFALQLALHSSDMCAQAPFNAKAFDRIPARMEEFVDDGKISGAVTLVSWKGNVVHLDAVGLADIQSNIAMRNDSIFSIASMTKPITATAIMILQDEEKLSVDDPVAKYLPAFANLRVKGEDEAREITIRHLMTHTSGVVASQRNQATLAATVEAFAQGPLAFAPGTQWRYGPGLSICGRIIEVVSKQPYDEFLKKRIFEPLGMDDTTFYPSAAQRKRLVKLYRPAKDERSLAPATHWLTDLTPERSPNPSGGLFSTAADMGRFYQMVLNGGQLDNQRLVSEKAVRQMTQLATGDLKTGFTDGNGWGLGWCIVREPQGVSEMLSSGSFGHGGAFGTQGWLDPQRNMVFVLMIQRTGFGNSDASEIRRAFQQLAVEALEKPAAVPAMP